MPLDEHVEKVLEQLRGIPALDRLSPAEVRSVLATMTKASPAGPELRYVANRFVDTAAGPLAVRIYRATDRPKGIIVYYHGGGWVTGNLDSADAQLRRFALLTDCCIVSVDYRLAPDHRFPAAVVDANAALTWVYEASAQLAGNHVPLLVAGDSAGGNLAAIVAILARDAGGPPIAGQLLFYPVTDANFDTPSYLEHANGMFLTRDLMRWFWDHYVPDVAQRADFRAAPMRTPDLSRLPAALIQTAEYDPLRDEGEAFAKRLAADGTSVTLQRRAGLIHGFFGMTEAVPAARAAIADAANWVGKILARHAGNGPLRYETLLLEQPETGVLIIKLNRPEAANALNTQMAREILTLFSELLLNPGRVRCIVLTGVGERAFCAGGDLKERDGMSDSAWRTQHVLFEQAFHVLMECPIPIIAAVNGAAYGGGCELALACDFIYAAETANFAQTETRLGIIPGGGGTQTLARAVGAARAKEIIYTATPFDAPQALTWGMINKVVPSAALAEEALATARVIAANGPIAIRQAKLAITNGLEVDLRTGLVIEIAAYNQTVPTADRREGISAANERRTPKFSGH